MAAYRIKSDDLEFAPSFGSAERIKGYGAKVVRDDGRKRERHDRSRRELKQNFIDKMHTFSEAA